MKLSNWKILTGVAILFFITPIITNAAGYLTKVSATPLNFTAGATTDYTIKFTLGSILPANGKISVEFPTGFNISNASSTYSLGGGVSTSTVGQVITLTRTSGSQIAAGTEITLGFNNVVNTSTVGNTYYHITVTTKNSSGTTIDGPMNSVYFQMFDTNTQPLIDGIYYLRELYADHGQPSDGNGRSYPGTVGDIGALSRTAPSVEEDRACGNWVQFSFDDNFPYNQTNNIDNIYYHVWWKSTSNNGTALGYFINGVYGDNMADSFAVSPGNSKTIFNKYNKNYNLYAGIQDTDLSFFGNDIYNFGITFDTSIDGPEVISFPTNPSFVILNVPSNLSQTIGLNGESDADYDDDELTDYDELYTYFTNPYDTDTDNDGYSDKNEIDNNLNPNDPDAASSFPKLLTKKFSNSVPDYFGYSVSSIGDQDGDGKEDVLVGAPGINSQAGAIYIYSSTGDLIRKIDGENEYNYFGESVSSIGDQDGDGKEDVLVGAPYYNSYTGAAYIYSSNGDLIKKIDGEAEGSFLGNSISSIGDQDGDGKEDVLVGAPNVDAVNSKVYIYNSTGNEIHEFTRNANNDSFGWSVSSISDQDGDEKEDVLIGSPGNYIDVAGKAYLYSSTGSLINSFGFSGDGALDDGMGNFVSSIGDQDGDGKEDVLVGASSAGVNAGDAGSIYIFSSATGNAIKRFDGFGVEDQMGKSAFSIGDQDGDGKEDVLVGAPNTGSRGASGGSAYIIYSNYLVSQSWSQATEKSEVFDLDDYFQDLNSLTIPPRNQTITYTASTNNNPNIDVSIDPTTHKVSFSQPDSFYGTESVTFTATDSTGLSSNSNTVTLTVNKDDSLEINHPRIPGQFVRSVISPVVSATNNTLSSLQSKINDLKSLIDSLLGKKPITTIVSPGLPSSAVSSSSFTANLSFGSRGNDVRQLQIFLNTHGYLVSTTGPGSPGNETTIFGYATKAALIRFQKANGIDPIGVFGPTTRGRVNGLVK